MSKKTPMHKYHLIVILCFSISLLKCNNKGNDLTFINGKSSNYSYKKITFGNLLNNDSLYHNQYIEIRGIFYNSMEEQSFYDINNSNTGVKNAFWVELKDSTDSPLIEIKSKKKMLGDGYFLNYLSSKIIVVRGRLNLLRHGHLGQYRGTIEQITYISTKE